MIQFTLLGCGWDVTEQVVPGSDAVQKTLVFQDQNSGIAVVVPLDDAVARQMAAKLEGKPTVDVATQMPPGLNGHDKVSPMKLRR